MDPFDCHVCFPI